jgi:hypothetical protein
MLLLICIVLESVSIDVNNINFHVPDSLTYPLLP